MRYFLAGLLALAADVAALLLLRDAGLHHQVHALCGFAVGMVVSFLLSRYWVFAHGMAYGFWASFAVATLITAVGVGINAGVNEIAWQWLAGRPEGGLDPKDAPLLAKLPAAALVMVWNFIGRRAIIFRLPPDAGASGG